MYISDVEINNFDFEQEKLVQEVYDKMKIAVKCPLCSRLLLYDNGFEKPPIIYKLEKQEIKEH